MRSISEEWGDESGSEIAVVSAEGTDDRYTFRLVDLPFLRSAGEVQSLSVRWRTISVWLGALAHHLSLHSRRPGMRRTRAASWTRHSGHPVQICLNSTMSRNQPRANF